jgi:hypothetical protein
MIVLEAKKMFSLKPKEGHLWARMVNQLDLLLAHHRQSTFIMATKGEWVGLFRNERYANPYAMTQKTNLFMPKISPNLVVFIIPHKVQVFCMGVQSHSL